MMATPIAPIPVSSSSVVTNTKTETNSNSTTVNSKMKVSYKGGEYVSEVLPNDVLLGRGSGPNDHEGNIKFRDMINHRKQEYRSTSNRQSKALIAKEVAGQVYEKGGRFLRKLNQRDALKQLPILLSKSGTTKEEAEEDSAEGPRDVYEVQDNKTVLEKAKQALRQNRLSPTTSPMGRRCPTNPKSPTKPRTLKLPKNNLSGSGGGANANAQAKATNAYSNNQHFNAWNSSGLGGSSTSFNMNSDGLFEIPPPVFTMNNNLNQNQVQNSHLIYAELLHQQQQQQQFIASQGQMPPQIASSSLQFQQQQQQQQQQVLHQQQILYQQPQQLESERQNALLQQQLEIQSQSQQQSHQQGGPIKLVHRHYQHNVSSPIPVAVTSKSSSTNVVDLPNVPNGYDTYTTTLDKAEEDKNNKEKQLALKRTSDDSTKSLQMSIMMESFKDMSVKSDGNVHNGTDDSITRAMHDSYESIGTIDNMHVGGSAMAHMSCMSMISTNNDSIDSLNRSKRNGNGGSEGGSSTQNASWGAAGTTAATSGRGTNNTKARAAANIAAACLGLGSTTANKQRGGLSKVGSGRVPSKRGIDAWVALGDATAGGRRSAESFRVALNTNNRFNSGNNISSLDSSTKTETASNINAASVVLSMDVPTSVDIGGGVHDGSAKY